MPYYRVGGVVMHVRMGKRQAKEAAPACPFFVWGKDADGNRRRERCLQFTGYQCDWPGCNVHFCEAHRLNLAPELDVCPTHNHQRGLFSRLLPAPTTESTQ
jgi:hypothetical protein